MSTTGKTSSYIRKTSVKESLVPNVGFKKTRFLHEASMGDTLIQLSSLVTPSDAVGYTAPNVSELTSTNLLAWKSNLTLTSSLRGPLMQNLAYVVNGSSVIKLLFEAEEGEVFEGVIDHNARTGLTMVDAKPLVASGVLLAGQTDFNVGEAFQVGTYPAAKRGVVQVVIDGQVMDRTDGNAAFGPGVSGDYYEVHAGGGLGQIIRVVADLTNDRNITVTSIGALVEKPNDSVMQSIETVQGQIDAMIPTLAALADVPESNFQSAPNNQDLKAFGDKVLQNESLIALLSVTKQDALKITIIKDVKATGVDAANGTGSYQTRDLNTQEGDLTFCTLNANQFTLDAGRYLILVNAPFYNANGIGTSKVKLRNVSSSSDVTIGQSGRIGADLSGTVSLMATITVGSANVFEIQQKVVNGGSNVLALGAAVNYGDSEVYTQVLIIRLGT